MAALWSVLALPRWIFLGGLAYLAFVLFREQVLFPSGIDPATGLTRLPDPDAVVPLFLQSNLLVSGVKGLVVTGLVAAYMSTFSSEVNASASILVRDIVQPLTGRHLDDESGGMIASYLATTALVVITMVLGYTFSENAGSTLNAVWIWMLGGLITCIVVPLALRWYWGRMNGWGYTAGSVVGLLPALAMLLKQFVSADHWLKDYPDSYFTYLILGLSLITCIVVSLLSRPVDSAYIDEFYRRVRPFGFWGQIKRRALVAGQPANSPLSPLMILVNLPVSIAAMYSLYMAPVYFMGKWFTESTICIGVFIACCATLYVTWYKTLPED